MSDTQDKRSLSDNAKRAEELFKQHEEDTKLAAEAMRRTHRYRRTHIAEAVKYNYERIS